MGTLLRSLHALPILHTTCQVANLKIEVRNSLQLTDPLLGWPQLVRVLKCIYIDLNIGAFFSSFGAYSEGAK